MSAHRLSPAQRNALYAITMGGLRNRQGLPFKTVQTLDSLRQRGYLDADYQPTDMGRAVFRPMDAGDSEDRRPGIAQVAERLQRTHPDWTAERAAAHAKHLYTDRGVRC